MFQIHCFTLMRRFFLYTTILFGSIFWGTVDIHAQEMKDIFIDFPKHTLPVLSKSSREKLIEEHLVQKDRAEQSLATTTNALGGRSFIQTLTPSYIHIVLDKNTEVQYKRLYSDEGTMIIGMIASSKILPRQSIIKFYDRTWKEIPTEVIITPPNAPDFLKNPEDSTQLVFKNALVERGHLDTYADFLPDEDTLIIHLSTFEDELVQKLHPAIGTLLDPKGVRYTWAMGRFKKIK